jgi:quinol monooxygenase YgiN
MKSFYGALVGAVLALIGVTQMAAAGEAPPDPNQGPVYVTTYYEVSPGNTAQALGFLKEYRDAARKEAGVTSSDLLQELGMPSRFITNEVWRNWAAYDAHTKAAARTQLHLKMLPIQFGPPDARTHLAHYVAPGGGAPGANSVFIVSHLDVTPNQLPRLLEIMKPLSEGSAKDAGMQTYQILRQAPGVGNHFRLYEVWASERAWDAHNLAAHTQGFRNDLAPLLGTPYDQRKYSLVN